MFSRTSTHTYHKLVVRKRKLLADVLSIRNDLYGSGLVLYEARERAQRWPAGARAHPSSKIIILQLLQGKVHLTEEPWICSRSSLWNQLGMLPAR